MKKITLFFALAIFTFFNSYGQLNVSVDNADGTGWNPYVNAFNISDGNFAFGFAYDLAKQKTEFDGTTVTVKPNYGIWVDECSNPAYFDTATCPNPSSPNKNIEALSYLQFDRTPNPEFFTQDVIFSGDINSYTLDAAYTVKAFISIFPGDFSYNRQYTFDVTATGSFTVTSPLADIIASDQFFQYGFIVFGPPADPANEGTLGSVVFQSNVLSTNDLLSNDFRVSPNPSNSIWNIEGSNTVIDNVEVFDLLGKRVLSLSPNNQDVRIDASALKTGIYLAKLTSNGATKTIKLVKN